MKQLLVLSCLLLSSALAAARKEKKTTLEDIEKEYNFNQKMTNLHPPPPPPPSKVPIAPSPTRYGFVPVKNLNDYVQQEPKQYVQQYLQYDTTSNRDPKKYTTFSSEYATDSSQKTVPTQIYTLPQRYSEQRPQSQSQVYYSPQSQSQDQSQYQKYETVQYVTDNGIGQAQGGQQYYTPQYVYLQQYPSSSTSVQTVVEPKGGVQYIMYIPVLPNAHQNQDYENTVYSNEDSSSLAYKGLAGNQQIQYVQPQLRHSNKPQVQYAEPANTNKYTKAEYILRREPKSLLDSYVPSILQLQYYKQAQAQQNLIREPQKFYKLS